MMPTGLTWQQHLESWYARTGRKSARFRILDICQLSGRVNQETRMGKKKYVTYCGLYCKLCSNMARIPPQARALLQTLDKGGWRDFGQYVYDSFDKFLGILESMTKGDVDCPGCREGCGDPGCKIRECAKAKGMELCSLCDDFPCDNIKTLAKHYPNLIADGMRQKEIGLESWIEEQEERCRAGACYDDFKYPQET